MAENPSRHKVVAAGRRFGKSYLGAIDKLLPEVFYTKPLATTLLSKGKRRIFWIVGPNFSDSEKEFRVIWDICKRLEVPMEKGSYYNPESGLMQINLWGGAMQIVAKSAQNPERLVGEGLSGVILSEAAKLKEVIWTKYIRPTLADFNGWSFHSSCLVADTLVWTDKGLVELGSMSPERTQGNYADLYDTKVVGFHGDLQTATKFYCNGVQDVLKVVGTNGFSIEGTPNHRVWSMDENGNPCWKYLGDLAIGDYMAVRQGAEIWGGYTAEEYEDIDPPQSGRWRWFNTELDCDMAYFMGLFIADGHMAGDKSQIVIHGGLDREIWDWLSDFGFHRRLRQVEGKQDVEVYDLGSYQLRHFMEYMGFVKCKSWEREIPWRARQMPRKLMVQLLAGLFDGDGCYNAKKHKIWYSTTSLKLARQIQSILVNMGIVANLTKLDAAQENWQDSYRLELTTNATSKFLKEIPLKIKRKTFEDREIGDLSVSKLPLQQERLLRLKSRYELRGKLRGAGYSSYGIEPWKNKMAGVSKVRQYLGRVERAYPEAYLDKDFQVLQQLCEEEYVWVEVKSIEAQGKKETFDLCVNKTHAYSANSIISHNTPEGKNWFYDLWRKAQDPTNKDWSSWRMPAWINNYVYRSPTKEDDVKRCLELVRQTNTSPFAIAESHGLQIDHEILSSINELTPEAFLQEIASDFTEFVGRVFKEFDEEYHVTDLQFHPGWDTYAAADFGYSNPNVWLLIQVGPWGEINVLDEIYESGLDPEDFADEIRYRGLNPPTLRYFFPDPADPLSTKILEKKLNIHARGGTGGELNNRINWIRKALRDPRVVVDEPYLAANPLLPPGSTRPRLLFDRRCAKTIQDMLNYRYPEKKSDSETSIRRYDLPMKRDDHGPEALGRFFAGMFGQFGKPATGVRVHKASFGGSVPNVGPKHQKFTQRGHEETNRTAFPKINDALGNYLTGAYDK